MGRERFLYNEKKRKKCLTFQTEYLIKIILFKSEQWHTHVFFSLGSLSGNKENNELVFIFVHCKRQMLSAIKFEQFFSMCLY